MGGVPQGLNKLTCLEIIVKHCKRHQGTTLFFCICCTSKAIRLKGVYRASVLLQKILSLLYTIIYKIIIYFPPMCCGGGEVGVFDRTPKVGHLNIIFASGMGISPTINSKSLYSGGVTLG